MEKKINDVLNIMENHGTGPPFMFPFFTFLLSYNLKMIQKVIQKKQDNHCPEKY